MPLSRPTKCRVRRKLDGLLLASLLFPLPMNSQVRIPPSVRIAVPNELAQVEGNAGSRLPFDYNSPVHYQQVYDASQFAKVPTGGAWVTFIHFRADITSSTGWGITNLRVNLSTTIKAPDHLSPVFAENVGGDATRVFGPAHYGTPGPHSGSPSPWDGQIELSLPFFYDPARGNLLLDLTHEGIWPFDGFSQDCILDTQDVAGDSVSRAAAFSLGASEAEVLDTVGLATRFQFDPTPELTVAYETNQVVLSWPFDPTTFRLQQADAAGGPGSWQDYPEPTPPFGFYRYVRIPQTALQASRFYRLVMDTPQPLPSPPTSPTVQVDAVIKP
jgi:hypothetical protein